MYFPTPFNFKVSTARTFDDNPGFWHRIPPIYEGAKKSAGD